MRTLDRHYLGVGPTTQISCGFRGAEYCTSPAERFEVEVRGNVVVPSPRCQAHVGFGLGDRLLSYETAHAWVSRAVEEERARRPMSTRETEGHIRTLESNVAMYCEAEKGLRKTIADLEQENGRLRAHILDVTTQQAADILSRSRVPPHEHEFTLVLDESTFRADSDPHVTHRRIHTLGCRCGTKRRVE